jgi:hypothetical protein
MELVKPFSAYLERSPTTGITADKSFLASAILSFSTIGKERKKEEKEIYNST